MPGGAGPPPFGGVGQYWEAIAAARPPVCPIASPLPPPAPTTRRLDSTRATGPPARWSPILLFGYVIQSRRRIQESVSTVDVINGSTTDDEREVANRRAAGEAIGSRNRTRRWVLRALGLLLSPARTKRAIATTALGGGASQCRSAPRIIVLRPDHLGDVLLSRPAIELLLAALPEVEITVAVGPWSVPALKGLPVRLAIFPFPGFTRIARSGRLAPYTALLAFAARLRREKYCAALVLRPDHWWGALAAAVAGVPVRVGHATPETSPFLTRSVEPSADEHATDSAVRAVRTLLSALGAPPDVRAAPSVRFTPSRAGLDEADAWISGNLGIRRPAVAIHPGAGALLKLWPPSRWAMLADLLSERAAVVLTGGSAEADLVVEIRTLARNAPPAVTDMGWDTLAGLYRRLDLVVGADSGPLHLAAAVGTPTVRIYGPTDPRVYGPRGKPDRHVALQSGLPCVPCGDLVSPPCGYLQNPPCLAAIPIEEMRAAARRLLEAAE
ncbi:MAG: hypothetical protein GEU73_03665 [Chloroflexi bacterium]|nr:hypothetical protein [Chloroflexota bacterium]